MGIKVANARKVTPEACGDRTGETVHVYVGRAWGRWPESVLGNPFHIGADGTRYEVIEKYRAWLIEQRAENRKVAAALDSLYEVVRSGRTLVLVCWCAPKACHADVIKGLLMRRLQEEGV